MAGYQARERQKVTRRRMDTRNKSDKPYLTLVEAMSFCRLNFSSLRHRRRRGAVSGPSCWKGRRFKPSSFRGCFGGADGIQLSAKETGQRG